MTFRTLIAGAFASLLIAACATVTPAPSFVQELSSQYKKLYIEQTGPSYEWANTKYFAEKSQRVAAGKLVQPEQPNTWNVPAEIRPEMNNAYDMLQIALVPDRKKQTSPIAAARAQAYFDCWVEQAHKKWTPTNRGQDCRAAFYEQFCIMYGGQCTAQGKMFRIYFDTNSTALDAEGRKAVADAVAQFNKNGKEVVVVGHTDAVGSAAYNLELSKKRAIAVSDALVDAGVPAAKINDKYYGKQHLLVPTADGVANAHNRRVLVVVR